MSTANKYMQSASGVGGAALDVDEVFSTYLYSGNSTARNISNGIDLSGEGGLVWTKLRGPNTSTRHVLIDTERGVEKYLESNTTDAEDTQSGNSLTAFNNNGYTIGNWGSMNASGQDYASWTFRKAPKFFDVVTYTGDGTSGQTINHNLGTNVGAIIIKCTDTGTNWAYWHRTFGSQEMIILNSTGASRTDLPYVSNVTDSSFTVNGSSSFVNENTKSHVAYVFAHNDSDGEFGPTGDADIIKCGSYTGTGSAGNAVDLGFEPQWVLFKNANRAESWHIWDTMRGIVTDGTDARLLVNTSGAEANNADVLDLNPTGFTIEQGNSFPYNYSGDTYIYIAIRRPTAVPESATEVFGITTYTGNATSGRKITNSGSGVVDLATITADLSNRVAARLTGYPFLSRDATDAAINSNTRFEDFDANDGFFIGSNSQVNTSSKAYYALMWTRAPNFFDVVAYTGNGTAGRTLSHNLGVAPEMMWVKWRCGGTSGAFWTVYHANTPVTRAQLALNLSNAASSDNVYNWNNTSPTATEFTLGAGGQVNANNDKYIAYLFASLDGISKVGSYTGNGSTQTIDCGFTSGARYVLIKRTNATGNWHEFHTGYGIVAGNEQAKYVNTGGDLAGSVIYDLIDPDSSGFIINQETVSGSNLNVNGASYIFYAIA